MLFGRLLWLRKKKLVFGLGRYFLSLFVNKCVILLYRFFFLFFKIFIKSARKHQLFKRYRTLKKVFRVIRRGYTLSIRKTVNNLFTTLCSKAGVLRFWNLGMLKLTRVKQKRSWRVKLVKLMNMVVYFVKKYKIKVLDKVILPVELRIRKSLKRFFIYRLVKLHNIQIKFIWIPLIKGHNGIRGKKIRRR